MRHVHHDQDGDELILNIGPRGPLVCAVERFRGKENNATVYYSRGTVAVLAGVMLNNAGIEPTKQLVNDGPATAEECEEQAAALLIRAALIRDGKIQ